MNLRNLIIAIALLLPLAAIVAIASHAPDIPVAPSGKGQNRARVARADDNASGPRPMSLDEAKRRVQGELDRLKRLSPEEWDAEQRQRLARGMPLPPPPGGEPPGDRDDDRPDMPDPQKDD